MKRYGVDEVGTWRFEVYNEADLHWQFSQYASMYAEAAWALKNISTRLVVGGPASARWVRVPTMGWWLRMVLSACCTFAERVRPPAVLIVCWWHAGRMLKICRPCASCMLIACSPWAGRGLATR